MPEESEKKRVCPCCGAQTLSSKIQLSQDILDYYISCIMTGQPFIRQYKLYDGRVSIKVSGISDQLSTKALKVTALLNKSKLQSSMQQALSYITYRLLPIIQISIYNNGQSKVFNPQSDLLKAIDKLLAYQDDLDKQIQIYNQTVVNPNICSTLPVLVIQKIVAYHTDLLNALIQHGLDQSFCASIQLD